MAKRAIWSVEARADVRRRRPCHRKIRQVGHRPFLPLAIRPQSLHIHCARHAGRERDRHRHRHLIRSVRRHAGMRRIG